MGPNTGDVFQLYDRIPIDKKTTDYNDAMTGNWTSTLLSKAYFSSENIASLRFLCRTLNSFCLIIFIIDSY